MSGRARECRVCAAYGVTTAAVPGHAICEECARQTMHYTAAEAATGAPVTTAEREEATAALAAARPAAGEGGAS